MARPADVPYARGTMPGEPERVNLRPARVSDVHAIHELIRTFAERKLMILRSHAELYETIRELVVADDEAGRILGCASLHVFRADLAEVRSVAVDPGAQGQGVGRRLIDRSCEDAFTLGVARVFTLTTATGFFEKCGFERVAKEDLPHAIWGECVRCPSFPDCPETALARNAKAPAVQPLAPEPASR
jgi:amino-acid N-acetyltransferase